MKSDVIFGWVLCALIIICGITTFFTNDEIKVFFSGLQIGILITQILLLLKVIITDD